MGTVPPTCTNAVRGFPNISRKVQDWVHENYNFVPLSHRYCLIPRNMSDVTICSRDTTRGLPLEVLACVFSYLSAKAAVRSGMERIQAVLLNVNRKWQDLVSLGDIPWTISQPNRHDRHSLREGMRAYRSITTAHPSVCIVHRAACIVNFVGNAIAFKFGSLPPTRLLMECIQSMQKLKRIQMPTCIGEGTDFPDGTFRLDLYSDQCLESLAHTDITHLAVTHIPCILSVYRFPHLTSLLISFGILDPTKSMYAVELWILTVVNDFNVLPMLQHLGLHQYANCPLRAGGISVDTIAGLLKRMPGLITLSLTGMFHFEQADVRKLLHPDCGLRSLAVNVNDADDAGSLSMVNEIMNASQVSLVVLCLDNSERLAQSILWGMFVAGFEPLRHRKVGIEGQGPYIAHPFRRVGMDVVWGLTAGALFAE
jgi:hypothetical protein